MYTRELHDVRPSPVENGVPLQGTWTRPFEEVDLLQVQRPYPFPLPRGLRDYRIKEWESFVIQDDRFLLSARLCNFKYYRSALVIMYNKESNERLDFRKIIPGGAWRLPRYLNNASVDSHSYGFFFRIHTWLDAGTISMELDIERTSKRPPFTALATFDVSAKKTTPMAVSLLFSEHRNMYTYKALAAVSGDLVSGGQHFHFDPLRTSGLFCDYKGFFPLRTRTSWVSGMGFDSQNRRFGFSLGESQAKEPYRNNENALWLDGALSPLPPVKITQNYADTGSEWIIQDMEGMVDLVFTPKESEGPAGRPLSARDEMNPLGLYNGLLVSSGGEEISLRNVWGSAEKLYLKV
ncbi:MAG: DUF2804 domain-containing protein [Treponema sp.]|nr:DUF2804 domain-containing protein [Treponema sp.]